MGHLLQGKLIRRTVAVATASLVVLAGCSSDGTTATSGSGKGTTTVPSSVPTGHATSTPYVVPGKYSPDSYAVYIWYDTKHRREGVHFNSSVDDGVHASYATKRSTDFFTLADEGRVTLSDSTRVSWKNSVVKGKSDLTVTIGEYTARGSQFGANAAEKQVPTDLSVEQVRELGILLAQQGRDHFSAAAGG